MTPHTHTNRVPGCYRCALGVDEVLGELGRAYEQIDHLESRIDALEREKGEALAQRDAYRRALLNAITGGPGMTLEEFDAEFFAALPAPVDQSNTNERNQP